MYPTLTVASLDCPLPSLSPPHHASSSLRAAEGGPPGDEMFPSDALHAVVHVECAVDGETVEPYTGAKIVQYFVIYGEPGDASAVPNPGVSERAARLRAIIRPAHEPSFRGPGPGVLRKPSGLFYCPPNHINPSRGSVPAPHQSTRLACKSRGPCFWCVGIRTGGEPQTNLARPKQSNICFSRGLPHGPGPPD